MVVHAAVSVFASDKAEDRMPCMWGTDEGSDAEFRSMLPLLLVGDGDLREVWRCSGHAPLVALVAEEV